MATESKTAIIIIANGFQTDYLLNLVHGLSEYCKVVLICSDDLEQHKYNSNVTVINLRGNQNPNVSIKEKVFRVINYYKKLFRFIRKTNIKVVHIQWIRFSLIDGILFSLCTRMFGKKVIYTAHDIVPHDRNTLLNRLIFRLVYKSQDEIIVHTEFIRNRILNEFNILKNKVHFIEHGVYNIQTTKEITCENARDYFNLSKDDFVILFFGRIAKYKGVELIASNINKFTCENGKVKLIIAGEVAKDYETDFLNFLNNIDTTNIIQRLSFIKTSDVELLFKSSDVTILPYKEASQSGVLFLSYAYGTPVIASRIGGFPNYIVQEKTGMLYDPKDELSFTHAINTAIHIFKKPNDELSNRIQTFANDNFSWNSSCRQLYSIYEKYQ